ncbi:hypothetical protein SCHPADRAFT_995829, partial [Schizopora paradoxa]
MSKRSQLIRLPRTLSSLLKRTGSRRLIKRSVANSGHCPTDSDPDDNLVMSNSMTIDITSLPPELLEIIFEHVLQDTIAEERALTALTLTHICSRFRQITIACPQLWTCLCRRHGRPGFSLINACIERSRNFPLDIVLYFYRSTENEEEMVVDPFMIDIVFPLRARWQSCTFQAVSDLPRIEEWREFDSWPSRSPAAFPTLTEFSVRQEIFSLEMWTSLFRYRSERYFQKVNEGIFPQGTPVYSINLHNTSLDAIPPNLLPQITNLSCTYIHFVPSRFNSVADLASATSLTTLHLSYNDCCFRGWKNYVPITELPSVRSVHYEFIRCTKKEKAYLWKSFSVLYFPNATYLRIDTDIGDEDKKFTVIAGVNITPYSFLAPNLVHHRRYPSLESLEINIVPRNPPESQRAKTSRPSLLLPHCCVPSLKSLRIRSSCDWDLVSSLPEAEKILPPYLGNMMTAPINLEMVTFELPRIDGVVLWTMNLALKMQRTHCWNRFSKLHVIRNGKFEVILRDDIQNWCDAALKRAFESK